MSLERRLAKADHVDSESNRLRESNDCAVRAIAHATGADYALIHLQLKLLGRKDRGCTFTYWIDTALDRLDVRVTDITVHARSKAKTVKTVSRVFKTGTYLIYTRGHILCLKDGKVLDWAEDRQLRIQKMVRVKTFSTPAITDLL